MPGDLIGDGLGAVLRIVLRIIIELFCEGLLCGTGRFLIRLTCPHCRPGDFSCAMVGFLFWAGLVAALFFLLKP